MDDKRKPRPQFLEPALFDNTKSGVQGRGVESNSKRSKRCHQEVRREFLSSGLSKEDFVVTHARKIGAGTRFSDGQGGARAYSDDTLEDILGEIDEA